MKYLALDQNRWIELSAAQLEPTVNRGHREVLDFLVSEIEARRLTIPLFQSNIYETHKIEDDLRREQRAWLQCTLSAGKVVRGLNARRSVEVRKVLGNHFNRQLETLPVDWFLSNYFWEATSEVDIPLSREARTYIEEHPDKALFHYLTYDDGGVRELSVQRYSQGMADVLRGIEEQRQLIADESLKMRRKVISARLWMDSQDAIWKEVDSLGIGTEEFRNSSTSIKRDLVRNVPCLHIERELQILLEAEPLTLNENDTRDMAFFCAAIPYMDVIAAEKAFATRSKHAKLDRDYRTIVVTSLYDIPSALADL